MDKNQKIKLNEFTVKQVAERLDMSEHTLRYYDRQGLMPFLKRNKNGVRAFTEEDICYIELIKCLKRSNMSLENIKKYIHLSMSCDKTSDVRKELLEKQKLFILTQIDELKKSLCAINHKIEHCNDDSCECLSCYPDINDEFCGCF